MAVKLGPLSPLEQIDLYTWSINRRSIRGEDFSIIPPLKHLYRDQSSEVYIEKAAQLFISEYFVNLALFAADTKWGGRGNVIYYFPATPQITDFSAARLDPTINMSPYLAARQVAQKEVNSRVKIKQNVGLKQVGDGMIYLRGSKSRTQMISVDADVIIFDEIDEMLEGTIEAGKERAGSSLRPFFRGGSTPRLPHRGVDALIQRSTNKAWIVTCLKCGHTHDLAKIHDFIFPLKQTAEYKLIPQESDRGSYFHRGTDYYAGCPDCHHILNVWHGEWVNSKDLSSPNVDFEGYHLPKLFSNRLSIDTFDKIAKSVERERDGKLSEAATQEFYNSVCGLPRAPQGVQCSEEDLLRCRTDIESNFELRFDNGNLPGLFRRCFLGSDIGSKKLHTVVIAFPRDNPSLLPLTNGHDKPVVVWAGSLKDHDEILPLFHRYDCVRAVVDQLPEYHATAKLCQKLPGRIYGALYPSSWVHQGGSIWDFDEDKLQVKISRADALGNMYEYIFNQQVVLPNNVLRIGGFEDDAGRGEFSRHLCALTRVVDDESKVTYENMGPDHLAHAFSYALVAAKQSPLDTSDVFNAADIMHAMYTIPTSNEKSVPVLPALSSVRRSSSSGFFYRNKPRTNHNRPAGY